MIQVHQTKTDDAWYVAAVQREKILATSFSVEEPDLKFLLQRIPDSIPYQVLKEPNQLLKKVLGALEDIFKGKDRESHSFRLSTDNLSGYSRRVLNCTCMVPIGYVTSYGAVAKFAGESARSVGRVEASNPIPLLIPCHRVVRSDLSVGGYRYGKEVKLEIIQREKRGYEESRRLEVEGRELLLFPAEWVKKQRAFKRLKN